MKQSAILIVSIFYCAFFMGQDLRFSRNFQTINKNVPLAIINNGPDYFYVLRYNKLAHDLIVERRRKSNAEMINLSPLKMDSVNARTFNYENLDYLFFAEGTKAFIVFEKVTTGRRSVYLRSCDTNGRVGPFVHLGSIERSANLKDFYFNLKQAGGGKVLIVASRVFHDNSVSRTAYLYNVLNGKFLWEKKLTLENPDNGYAQGFNTDSKNNLFYFTVNATLVEYRRQYVNHYQRMMPVYHYDSVTLHYSGADNARNHSARLALSDLSLLNSVNLFVRDTVLTATAHFSKMDPATGEKRSYFLGQRFNEELQSREEYVTPLKKEISEQLDFFDGGDTREAADKQYDPVWQQSSGTSGFELSGRQEEDFSKEMIFRHTDLNTGRVIYQSVVPRKIFYFAGRTRFKSMGSSVTVNCKDTVYTFVLEHVSNDKILPKDFHYSKFEKQEYAKYATLACYYYSTGAEMKKKVILKNIDYDCIPLNYQGTQRDIIFFQTRGSVERFAFLKLNQF